MSRVCELRTVLTVAAALLLAATEVFAQGASARADFNADGFDDLAIGVPGHGSGGVIGAGAVHILYGSSLGLDPATDQFFSQNSTDVPGSMENDDNCGSALATGDFDGNGYTDLAVGCPGEAIGSAARAGAVIILYGSSAGLRGVNSRFFSQDSTGVPDAAETDDRCGASLASGDFNADGRADLAWGCPGEKFGAFTEAAGAANVVYGASGGLTGSGGMFIHQNLPEVPDDEYGNKAEGDDRCGQALAAADFNGDGRSDLAMGCPGEDVAFAGIASDAGVIVVLFGSATGVTGQGSRMLIESVREAGDQCGSSLAAGDFDGNGRADLAAGCPRDDDFLSFDSGNVDIYFGIGASPSLQLSSRQTVEGGDRCGSSLATGDFDNDGLVDLAWGCPGEDSGAGIIEVLHGRSDRTFDRNQIWGQDSLGIAGAAQAGDQFGQALASGDYDNDGFADLAVGVPGEDIDGLADAGAVHAFYGTDAGLSAARDQLFTENTTGIAGASESRDRFGFALAGSGGVSGPGLTGRWIELARTCQPAGAAAACRLTGTFEVINPSTQNTPAVVLRYLLSTDGVADAGDTVLGQVHVGALRVGDTARRRVRVDLPVGVDPGGAFVIAVVDADNVVLETDEANNFVPFGPLP